MYIILVLFKIVAHHNNRSDQTSRNSAGRDGPNTYKSVNTSHRITGFLHFFNHPVFYKIEKTTLRKLDLLRFSGEGGKTPTHLGPT
jgi:hypothetical protein